MDEGAAEEESQRWAPLSTVVPGERCALHQLRGLLTQVSMEVPREWSACTKQHGTRGFTEITPSHASRRCLC